MKKEKKEEIQIDDCEVLEKRKKELMSKIKSIEKTPQISRTDSETIALFELEDEVENLNRKILEKEKEKENLTKFFLENGEIIFKHHKELDNNMIYKKEEDTENEDLTVFFNMKRYRKNKEEDDKTKTNEINMKKYCENIEKIQSKKYNIEDDEYCKTCNVEKVLLRMEALMICPSCSRANHVLVDSNKPSFKDPPRDLMSYSYKRINHFNEWLAQFQAKESTDIPEEVYNKILIEFKKERLSSNCITQQKVKDILKKLGYSKYYEHVPHIIYHLSGKPAPVMNRQTEEKLRSMFKEIQTPFVQFCPSNRKNFLSYSYCLHKLCQLLGLDEFLPCFPLLKSREKLHQQDIIWEQICNHLKWEFIKSV